MIQISILGGWVYLSMKYVDYTMFIKITVILADAGDFVHGARPVYGLISTSIIFE